MNGQPPLVIPFADDGGPFIAAPSNAEARRWLERTGQWPDHRLALWGGPCTGKTLLLRDWTAEHRATWREGPNLRASAEIVAEGGIAIDDADRADEESLLHVLNIAHDLGRPVLLASRAAPARWPVALRDLASRLRAITAIQIADPGDDLLYDLLPRWLAERQLVAAPSLRRRLMTRLPRSPEILRAAIEWLDRDALAGRRRKVTPVRLTAALAAVADPGPAGPDGADAAEG